MERTHEFTINLRDHGTYAVNLLKGVQVERCEGADGRPLACVRPRGDRRKRG